MTKLPFGKGISADQIFKYPQLEELRRLMKLTVDEKSIGLVFGESGAGKTIAVHSVVSELPANRYSIVYLGRDQNGTNLIKHLAQGLGLQPKHFRVHAWMQIAQHLSDNFIEQDKTPVVVVDEAHLLDDNTLEDLRLLTNTDFDRSSPLALILLAQLPIRARLKAPGLEAFCQRLRFRYALEGFTEEETAAYIKHHLRLADLPEDFFTADAVKLVFLASGGLPREINNYCTLALLKAQAASLSSIDAKLTRQVIEQRELN